MAQANTTTAAPGAQTSPETEAPEGYVVQDLDQRYLKSRVLEEYIQERPEEFGNKPRFEMKRDYHRIIVKRFLRDDEIRRLQRESFPSHFANAEWA